MTDRTANITAILMCLLFAGLALISIHLNPPFGIATLSRALYVDEGFYSDAAQNFAKFGSWGQAYDLRHWPGAPMVTLLQTAVFSVFGVSVSAIRLISVLFATISMICLYLIGRPRLTPSVSLALSVTAVATISFASHARAAIADPVAVGFAMLAIVFYLRLNHKLVAIVVSLITAYLAFLSKMYFLFVPVTVVILWCVELFVSPGLQQSKVKKSQVYTLISTVLIIVMSYVVLRSAFSDSFGQFMHINSNKVPNFDVLLLLKQFLITLNHIPFNTKTHIFLICLTVLILYFLAVKLFSRQPGNFMRLIQVWGREGWAMTVFLILGFGTITALNIPTKSHYFYFSILPICFLAILGLRLVLHDKMFLAVVTIVLICHSLLQASYYSQWLTRQDNYSVDDATRSIIELIEKETSASEPISIIGQYASQLGLYDNRLMPLDLRWSTKTQLCTRINYWRPKYLVDFYFPARGSYSQDMLLSCEQVSNLEQPLRFSVFKQWQDELIFQRINYTDDN